MSAVDISMIKFDDNGLVPAVEIASMSVCLQARLKRVATS